MSTVGTQRSPDVDKFGISQYLLKGQKSNQLQGLVCVVNQTIHYLGMINILRFITNVISRVEISSGRKPVTNYDVQQTMNTFSHKIFHSFESSESARITFAVN